MGSNNFDGPVLLDSLALQRGYFGTGGRAIDESVGPRYSGGAPADPNGVFRPGHGLHDVHDGQPAPGGEPRPRADGPNAGRERPGLLRIPASRDPPVPRVERTGDAR